MSKVLIVTSYVEYLHSGILDNIEYDKIICADGGLSVCHKLNLSPDYFIGDWDSVGKNEKPEVNRISGMENVITLPAEKDMTDSEAAVDFAVRNGFDRITLLGGLGGRFDHTMGNIGILAKYCVKGVHIALLDGCNYVFMVSPGCIRVPASEYKYLGVISHSEKTSGLTLRGVKYPLSDYILTNRTTLGVSNEITEKYADISFTSGMLLIVLSKDRCEG